MQNIEIPKNTPRAPGYSHSRYEDGLATYREKVIIDHYIGEDSSGDTIWKRITDRVRELYPDSSDEAVAGLIGKRPAD